MNDKIKTSIFLLDNPKQSFSDEGHLVNFTKYLFSSSQKHQTNHNTKLNTYYLNKNFNNPLKVGRRDIDIFIDNVKNFNISPKDLFMDLTYVFFVIKIGGYVISNFLSKKDDEISIEIDERSLGLIVEKYFNEDTDKFIGHIENIATDNKIVLNYSQLKENDVRLFIDKILHKDLDKNMPTSQTLISISHQDQDSIYHIHRVLQ